MQSLKNLVHLLSVAPEFINLYRSRASRRPELTVFLKQHIPEIDELSSVLQKRIQHYLFANAITTQWFSLMLGKKLNTDEKLNCELMGVATPLFDSLFDHLNYDLGKIDKMLSRASQDHLTEACRKLYQISLTRSKHPELFVKYFHNTMIAQERSLQQKDTKISKSILQEITYQKGGFALLLYRTALSAPIANSENDVIYQLGGIMQVHNDIFDLHRDLSEDTITLMTRCEDIASFQELFQSEIQKTKIMILDLPYELRNLKKLNILFSLAINSGLICLNQFHSLQKSSHGKFLPKTYSRDQLICDMDKLKNISKTILLVLNN